MPSYHLCPDLRIPPPPNGHLTLGTILKGLGEEDVQFPLNKDKVEPVDPQAIQPRDGPHIQRGFTRSMNEIRSAEGSIWAKIFSSGSLSAKFSRSRGTGDVLTVKELLTRTFTPDEEYMYKSLEIPKVRIYITTRRLEVPVYMITGIMVAKGASWTETKTRATEMRVEGGMTEPNTGSSVGATAGSVRERESTTGVEDSDDFVLGIRVRKIWWKDGVRQTSDRVVGSVLDSDKKKGQAGKIETDIQFADDFELKDSEIAPERRLVEDGVSASMEPVVWILP